MKSQIKPLGTHPKKGSTDVEPCFLPLLSLFGLFGGNNNMGEKGMAQNMNPWQQQSNSSPWPFSGWPMQGMGPGPGMFPWMNQGKTGPGPGMFPWMNQGKTGSGPGMWPGMGKDVPGFGAGMWPFSGKGMSGGGIEKLFSGPWSSGKGGSWPFMF